MIKLNDKRNIFIIFLLSLSVYLGFRTYSLSSQKNFFDKNQICISNSNLANEVAADLDQIFNNGILGDEISYSVDVIDIFYSSFENNCFFVIKILEQKVVDDILVEVDRYSIYKVGTTSPWFNGDYSEYQKKRLNL